MRPTDYHLVGNLEPVEEAVVGTIWHSACESTNKVQLQTMCPSQVTCDACKRTEEYKHSLLEEELADMGTQAFANHRYARLARAARTKRYEQRNQW